jgi:membrane associated rhomboid family serine protease
MLIVPLTGKISRKNPPFVTIALVLFNTLIFFAFQLNDTERLYEAEAFYFDSGLAEIEVPHYLASRGYELSEAVELIGSDEEALLTGHHELESDARFLEKLRNERIITAADPEYANWKMLREVYEDKLSRVVFLQYGFRPAQAKPVTFFSYMFLHGGTAHLLGNMLFLWLLGCLIEAGCGRGHCLMIYLLGGLAAVLLYWAVYWDSTVALVGASGAIAALMGAFTVLFGTRRVTFFYTVGVYFNTIRLPAILLLPVWVGKEFFQLFIGGVSQVAYVAHIGGLLGGALLGCAAWRTLGGARGEAFEEAPSDELSPLMARALERIGALDFDNARQLLDQVVEKAPANTVALTHLFNIEKHRPASERFHQVTRTLLDALSRDCGSWDKTYRIYTEYVELCGTPRLSPQLYLRISTVCAGAGHPDQAARILALLLKKKADLPGISAALLKLADAYRSKGKNSGWQKCLQLISRQFPDSPEAQIARKSLQGLRI